MNKAFFRACLQGRHLTGLPERTKRTSLSLYLLCRTGRTWACLPVPAAWTGRSAVGSCFRR